MYIYDFDKIQKDYLTAALKAKKKGSQCAWILAHNTAENTTIISDKYFMAIIPDDLVFVKSDNMLPDIKNLLRIVQPKYALYPATNTGMKKTIDKETVCIFETNNDTIYVNEKYIKYFAGMDCEIYGTTKKSPLQVYVNENCVGVILPINHND